MPEGGAAEARWRLSIDTAPVGLALVSLDGRFLDANATLHRLLGLAEEDIARLSLVEVTHPGDLQTDAELRERLLTGELPEYRSRIRCLHANGGVVWVDLAMTLVRDSTGAPMHFVAELHDADDDERRTRELLEQTAALERSNRELEAFALLASHDLLAPLSTVRGYLELLISQADPPLGRQARRWATTSLAAAERMTEMLASLLDVARAAPVAAAHERIAMTTLLTAVTADLAQDLQASGGRVETVPPLPHLTGEPTGLRQVVQNLLQNSLKYSHPDRPPHVVVSSQPAGDGFSELRFSDNGVGIPDEHKERVFGFFQQLDGRSDGHGIGLSTCKKIVERHGGRIWVEDNPGGGTVVCVSLPV